MKKFLFCNIYTHFLWNGIFKRKNGQIQISVCDYFFGSVVPVLQQYQMLGWGCPRQAPGSRGTSGGDLQYTDR